MKKLVSLLLIGIMSFSFIGCSQNSGEATTTDTSTDTSQNGEEANASTDNSQDETTELLIGTNAEFPPFEFIADNESGVLGKYDGIDMAIAKKIGEKVGKEVVIMDMPFDSLALAYSSNKIDLIIAAMTITEEKKESLDFSIPYYSSKQYIAVAIDNTEITSDADLAGKKIGVQTGTTGDFIATDDIENSEVYRYPRPFDAFNGLMNGDIDAVVVDVPVAELYVNQYADKVKIIEDVAGFPEEEYGIAVEKGNEELLNSVNEVLTEMLEAGEIDDLTVTYSEMME